MLNPGTRFEQVPLERLREILKEKMDPASHATKEEPEKQGTDAGADYAGKKHGKGGE